MTISYSIDPDEKLIYLSFSDETDLAETLEVLRQLAADERLGENFGILADVRVTPSIPTAAEARMIASALSNPELLLRHPVALVVSQMVQYGMANMISIMAGLRGATAKAFYDMEEAKAWLRMHRDQERKP